MSTDTNIWVKEPDATGTLRAVQRDVVWTLHTVRATAGSCQATQAAFVGWCCVVCACGGNKTNAMQVGACFILIEVSAPFPDICVGG